MTDAAGQQPHTAAWLLALGMRKLQPGLPAQVPPEVQAAFDAAQERTTDPEARAKVALLRAFYTVPGFMWALSNALQDLQDLKDAQALRADLK